MEWQIAHEENVNQFALHHQVLSESMGRYKAANAAYYSHILILLDI